ncbi:CHAT domain-containing protein [Variovorax sp. J22R133]|uniref:CHAT domain-containing protein n=1 Tax=Variovorax brevis TaxID=3053503 RepID=UPI002574977B|nr:CHAT domain-containing protein [Variovorax sp. J22R133]MDM0112263.1 CHAT domain-containing protein [Variovorax sp. J22R133]
MTDLQIRIFARRPDAAPGDPYVVEAQLDAAARFQGEASFDTSALIEKANDPVAYGRLLRDALLASPALQRAYLKSAASTPVHLRLVVDPPDIAVLRWERLMLDTDEDDRPAATSPYTPFSRYVELEELPSAATDVPTLLLAIANPGDLRGLPAIDVEGEIDLLLDTWGALLSDGNMRLVVLSGQTPLSAATMERLQAIKDCCRLVEGPTTLDTLSRELQAVNALHLIAHGNLSEGKAVLWLEKPDGTVALVEGQELKVKFQLPRLRLAFLHSCKGSAGTAGLGPLLVSWGVPAVVAMQDFVPMADARRFASAFYASLMQEGAVDIAVNAGRQSIFRSRSANWSIPVLFCRLKDGRVWKADPVRAAAQKLAKQRQNSPGVREPFPLDARLVRGGLSSVKQSVEELAGGPKLDLMVASRKALEPLPDAEPPYVVLLGSRGRAKSSHLHRLFCVAALGDADAPPLPMPLPLTLGDCSPELATPAATIAWAVAAAFRREGIAVDGLDAKQIEQAMNHREFLLLVDGDDDIGGPARTDAIGVLARFQRESAQKHRVLLTADSLTFDPGAPHPAGAVALILQVMTPERVSPYLKKHCPQLEIDLQSTRLFDLAGVPWLLGRLMDSARQNTKIKSRADILGRFVREALARLEGAGGARNRAEQGLSRMAWRMQATRQVSLSDAEVYKILAEVRGNRDFQLQQFLEGILKESGLLVWSGTEGVSFAYRGLQWHYCAKYLDALPPAEHDRHLEDITATLGRLSRAYWWDVTLVVLAGLTDNPDLLVRQILAGSALTEGEQVFIAARCVHEARGAQRFRTPVKDDVVDQIVDTLVWRSRHENARSTATRLKAIRTLGLLADVRVIPYLVSLATQKVRWNWERQRAYDYSGVRLAAAQALFGMQEATLAHVAQDPVLQRNQQMQQLLGAWLRLDIQAICALLDARDAGTAAVAAFALGTFSDDAGSAHLLSAFRANPPESGDADVTWAITDAIAMLDPVRVTKEVVEPLLPQAPWSTYLAYLIGRLGVATPDTVEFEFLRRSVESDNKVLAGRALRSYATLLGLQGASAPQAELDTLRQRCHQLVEQEFEMASDHGRARASAQREQRHRQRLRYQAFEALRSIGNEESIAVLRKVRQREWGASIGDVADVDQANGGAALSRLDSLNFEISEVIYWRLSGGLGTESGAPLGSAESAN